MTGAVDAVVRAAAEAMRVGLVVSDRDGRYLFINEALAAINGRTVAEHDGRTCLELLGELGPEVLTLHRRVIDTGEPVVDVQMSGSLDASGGAPRRWRASYFPAVSGDERVSVATVVEVTAEEAAREEAAQRASRQASLARLAAAALEEEHADRVFDVAVTALRRDLGADVAGVVELQPDGQQGLLRAGDGWPRGEVGSLRVRREAGSHFDYVLDHGGPVVCPDLRTEHRFEPAPILLMRGVRSGLDVAIRVDGRPWGLLGVQSGEVRAYSADDVDHLSSIAGLISAAVAREDRRRALERVAAERRRLTTVALQAAEDERRRIAEILHDELLQNLLYARQECLASDAMRADEGLGRAARALEEATGQLRALIGEVHPVALSHKGLRPAVETVAAELARRGGIDVDLDLELEAAGSRDAFAVGLVRELLTNVVKHAEASRVAVRVAREDGDLAIRVLDDGVGLSDETVRSAVGEGHVGLAAMRERVEDLGGRFELGPGLADRGAGVRVTVPL